MAAVKLTNKGATDKNTPIIKKGLLTLKYLINNVTPKIRSFDYTKLVYYPYQIYDLTPKLLELN